MKKSFLLLFLLACGDNIRLTPDASWFPPIYLDAPASADAQEDAPTVHVDASTDAPADAGCHHHHHGDE
jgi:hypothetical protein